ncbi:MAG: Sodium/hydrogen exchanger, partial [Bryobacterales bacterium]|nr:Sodium/hydrogen exchanger [Bryobacterales bacterium]
MFKKSLLPYLLLVGLPLAILVAVLKSGTGMVATGESAIRTAAAKVVPAPMDMFLLVLQVMVILLASRLVGMVFRKIGQPQVVGEMVAGILLGPSLLGWAAPTVSHFLFPAASLGYLNALSQIGLIFFMFIVGISLHPAELKKDSRAALMTSHASIVAPFCLG